MPENVQGPDRSDRAALRADCASCFGLCCVALTLTRSADFAIDKDAGKPCGNLQEDFRCGIHTELRTRGFPGCTVYDCFGRARRSPARPSTDRTGAVPHGPPGRCSRCSRSCGSSMNSCGTSRKRCPWNRRALHGEIRRTLEETERLTHLPADAFSDLDVAGHRDIVAELLLRTSELVRETAPRRKKRDRRGADLIGARLKGADLREPICAALT